MESFCATKPSKLRRSLSEDEIKVRFFKSRRQEARETKLSEIYFSKWLKFVEQKTKATLLKVFFDFNIVF